MAVSEKSLKNLKKVKRGQSTNPRGGSKKARAKRAVSELLEDYIEKVSQDAGVADVFVDALVTHSIKGNPKALELVAYYRWGKPKEQIEQTVEMRGGVSIYIPDNGR